MEPARLGVSATRAGSRAGVGNELPCRLSGSPVALILEGGFGWVSWEFEGGIGGEFSMRLERGRVSKSSREKTIGRFRVDVSDNHR